MKTIQRLCYAILLGGVMFALSGCSLFHGNEGPAPVTAPVNGLQIRPEQHLFTDREAISRANADLVMELISLGATGRKIGFLAPLQSGTRAHDLVEGVYNALVADRIVDPHSSVQFGMLESTLEGNVWTLRLFTPEKIVWQLSLRLR